MLSDDKLIKVSAMRVTPGKKVDLRKYPTEYTGKSLNKRDAAIILESGRQKLAEMQDKFYAHNRFGVLIILQAMDAAGKDGVVKHLMSGLNPQGVKVHSFKAPNDLELDHDYFWRHSLALPGRGEISIHNRSHYENVLITRVHPDFILHERLPDITHVKQIDDKFFKKRFKQIRRYEKNLVENGTVVLKFFLHLSRKEQRKRFLDRIEDKTKNWKFSSADLRERAFSDLYHSAYEEALAATSTPEAPWYVIPADDKWFSRLAIAAIIFRQFEQMPLHYPQVSDDKRAELKRAWDELMSEGTGAKKKPKKKKKKG